MRLRIVFAPAAWATSTTTASAAACPLLSCCTQLLEHRLGNVVLDRKNIVERAVIDLGPQVVAVAALTGCTEMRTRLPALHAAFEHGGDVQRAADLRDAGLLALEAERRGARRNPHTADLRQHVQQLIGEAVGEEFVLRAALRFTKGSAATDEIEGSGEVALTVAAAAELPAGESTLVVFGATRAAAGLGELPVHGRAARRRAARMRVVSRRRAVGSTAIAEARRHAAVGIACVVDRHRHQKRLIVGHQKAAVDRQAPLPTEIAFRPRLGIRRDDRHE